MRISLPSYAKINWNLRILGVRPDGYHELRTIFQTVDFSDQLTFEPGAGPGISLEVRGKTLSAGPENLVVRAAHALREHLGHAMGARIELHKRIPLGAGLGGGSSNAAVTLLALNKLWGAGQGLEDLGQIAARLGSDVPFFLTGGTALGKGRGERIVPMPEVDSQISILLFYPRFEVSAAEAYRTAGFPPMSHVTELTIRRVDTKIQRFHASMLGRSWSPMENDLEAPVFSCYPSLKRMRDSLLDAGCEKVMLCGSGSTLLALGKESSLQNVSARAYEIGGEAFFCRPLSRNRYREALQPVWDF